MGKVEVKGIEVSFKDLTAEAQKRLYLSNKKEFEKEAITSEYAIIRKMVIQDENTSKEALEEGFKFELDNREEYIRLYWERQDLPLREEKRKVLANSSNWVHRNLVAGDEKTSNELLNEMLIKEEDRNIIDTITNNKEFQMKLDSLQQLAKSRKGKCRLLVAKCKESPSDLLNELLQIVVKNKYSSDEVDAIMSNDNFKMEEKSVQILAKTNCSYYRKIAARLATSEELLDEMLVKEIERWQDGDVITAIMKNVYFKMREGTLIVIANSKYYDIRQIAIENEGTSEELLKDMYEKEEDEDNKELILDRVLPNIMKKYNVRDENKANEIFGALRLLQEGSYSIFQAYEDILLEIKEMI